MHVRIDTMTGLASSEGLCDTLKRTVSGDLGQVFLAPRHTEILGERIHVQENIQH